MPAQDHKQLPRLLYVGDVPVEATYHGSALLHRLLSDYPFEKLMIIEGSDQVSVPARRLPSVRYEVLNLGSNRLRRTRFSSWHASWLTCSAGLRCPAVHRLCAGFSPEAVVTVAHGVSWITAARYAASRGLPLHLICHDDWPRFSNVITPLLNLVDAKFGAIYRQAASRLCVSPSMKFSYLKQYDVDSIVLYPSRDANCPAFESPPERLANESQRLTVGFGGSINSPGYARALKDLAEVLLPMDGRLLIFGPVNSHDAALAGLNASCIEIRGLVTSDQMMERFRAEVDILFVPMSFEPGDRANMEISFPSKLTDYTATGLPILIYGPPYCSAVNWANQNPGVAEVVVISGMNALRQGVQALTASRSRMVEFGARALAVGAHQFSHGAAQKIFYGALNS